MFYGAWGTLVVSTIWAGDRWLGELGSKILLSLGSASEALEPKTQGLTATRG